GVLDQFDTSLLLTQPELSLAEGAILPWKGLKGKLLTKVQAELKPFFASRKFDWETPLTNLKPAALEIFFRGDDKQFIGVSNILDKELATTSSETRQRRLSAYRGAVVCAECKGARLRAEARSVLIGELAIHQITALTIGEAIAFFDEVEFHPDDEPIFLPIVTEISSRLKFLDKVGVAYLTLNRSADSLSGGELQRVRLATSIGSGLVGVCYILDEPSIGLHSRDNQSLIDALRDLQQLNNSVLVVEHDEAMMRVSDHLIDMGPGAGRHGGQIVAAGTPQEVSKNNASLTGQYLAGDRQIGLPDQRRRVTASRSVELLGAATNNLQDIDVRFPLGALVCVTGVSGSGKSSLVNETLARALNRRLGGSGPQPGPHRGLRGANQLDKLVEIDQSPIGRTPRSNPATYTGVFDEIRKVFSGTRQSKQLGYGVGRFSFNVKGGRCDTCQGQGQQKIDMNFLPDIYVTCNDCSGARFNRQTLEILYRVRSIADVLEMQIEMGVEFFENFPPIHRTLHCLDQIGLGYLTLGQSSITLSGGEAQRIKLATELARVETGNTMYILDEPTTGLHFDDVRKLLDVLGLLVEKGNSVLVIEHNLDVIKSADWIIDLGPEGGAAGGQLVAMGTPEDIATNEASHTGRFLKPHLKGSNS
ncbi:MAG: excinuclease ABC subunit UvrA, partial [Planctomycetales bacterium]